MTMTPCPTCGGPAPTSPEDSSHDDCGDARQALETFLSTRPWVRSIENLWAETVAALSIEDAQAMLDMLAAEDQDASETYAERSAR